MTKTKYQNKFFCLSFVLCHLFVICALSFVILLYSLTSCFAQERKTISVRVGHFSNITHAQAVIGHANGWFEENLASDAVIDWKIFNAGPSAVEALFAGQLDIAYIGPSPAINGYVKSSGEAIRVIAGSASGGAALVMRGDAGIEKPEDFKGKKIASPQLGNTQDVSLRAWLSKNDLRLKEVGGDVQVLPLANADQLTLFLKKEIDAAWTVEPWVQMLVQKAGGQLYLDESDLWPEGKYTTTLVIVNSKFLSEHPDLVKKFLDVHVELTDWIGQHPQEAKEILKNEIEKETHKELPESILNEAFKRILFTYDPLKETVIQQSRSAFKAGFLRSQPDLDGFFDLKLLEEVLSKRKTKAIET